MRRAGLVFGLFLIIGGLTGSVAKADYEYTAESSACGYLRFYPPRTGQSGALPDSYLIRGPAGALFGRTIGAVKSQLVWWTVPMSDGARVRVHRRLLPALRLVEQNLAAAAAQDLHYQVKKAYTSGFSARTSTSHDGISHHGLGAAIDINAPWNPYRLDGTLITDMPDWFVEAWEEAGLCWGGSWNNVKDPMHFSWNGPKATPGFGPLPAPLPPRTSATSFTTALGSHEVVFGPGDTPRFVEEFSGDGAPDVVHIRPWGGAQVLEASISRAGFGECSVRRWWLGDLPAGDQALADVTASGRPDLLVLDTTGATLRVARYAADSGYTHTDDLATAVATVAGRLFQFGDFDGDGADDLWVIDGRADGVDVTVWSAPTGYTEQIGSGSVPGITLSDSVRLALADRVVDGREDLLIIAPAPGGSTVSVVSARDLSQVAESVAGPSLSASDVVGFQDYDGDGRPDLLVLDGATRLRAWRGNTALGGSASAWFLVPDFECPDDTAPYHYLGRFADDDSSEFQGAIEWLAARGITRGCNPPFEDRFCPYDEVSRGEMAAFLVRALGLPPGGEGFDDSTDSVFGRDIAALAGAGITRGCDPPDNRSFCPEDAVTRGQMAAFLSRAFDLDRSPNSFLDDDGSVFEADIASLAAAGITRGCDPPANRSFCPDDAVTRGQMAAFLYRARSLLPAP